MSDAPEQIWIDTWGGNWSPVEGGTQTVSYIRADLAAEVLRLRETEAALRAEVARLVAAGVAVLYHDERGQGVGYAEAMDALEAAVDHARAALGDKGDSHDR